jgi:hypothetical protein
MAEIDWEGVLEEADDTARSLLAERLGEADDIAEMMILWRDQEGTDHMAFFVSTPERAIAMMELAKFNLLLDAKREVGEL